MKWGKKEAWLSCIIIGVCLLATSMVIGETFYYQIPLGCVLIMIGVGLESFRN
jgi:ABC-type Fe3+-siderophore transport system permease subunit